MTKEMEILIKKIDGSIAYLTEHNIWDLDSIKASILTLERVRDKLIPESIKEANK